MRRLDDFLIDRVFQKIADALHRVASCYAIGSFLLVGFAAMHFLWYALAYSKGQYLILLTFGLMLSLFWVPIRVVRAIRIDKQWAEGRDALPPERISDAWFRLFFLLMLPFDAFSAYLNWISTALGGMIGDLSWFMLVAGAYFLACTPKRPSRQTQRQWAWGSSR